jgi:hypothetical protein
LFGRTSAVPTQPKPIATWDPDLDCWIASDDDPESLFSVPSLVYSETFPVSGMTLAGTAYELPTLERHTDGSECSSSPTLRTPNAYDGERGGTQHPQKRLEGGHQPSLADQIEYLNQPYSPPPL